jgi:hypothetical protein
MGGGGALGVLGHKDKREYMEDLLGGHAPVAGDQVVDEDQHLELGQLVPRARVHAVPKWQEGVRPRRHLLPTFTSKPEKRLISKWYCNDFF